MNNEKEDIIPNILNVDLKPFNERGKSVNRINIKSQIKMTEPDEFLLSKST